MTTAFVICAFAAGYAACWFTKDEVLKVTLGGFALATKLEAKAKALDAKAKAIKAAL